MTVHLVTFSDESMTYSRELCAESASTHGVDITWPWWKESVQMLTPATRNPEIFRQPEDSRRAWAWWAWKPAIVFHHLQLMRDGDILIYSDAGVEFINNVSHIINRMDQDIFLFGNNWEHAHWCKRDVIDAVYPLRLDAYGNDCRRITSWDKFGKQCQASVIFFRVSDYSRSFVAEWLKWCLHRIRHSEGVCTDEWRYLIDDSPSRAPNHPEFREHRHDQAILTTMAYREGIKLHYWPAMYNDGAFNYEKLPEYAGDNYPILFLHHRRRNHEWEAVA